MLESHVFLALSKLPHLESLTLYPSESNIIATALALPEDAFPSLRHLHLNKIEHSISDLCRLKPLVRQLAALEITLEPFPPYSIAMRCVSLTSVICTLVKNNKILSSLRIINDSSTYVEIHPKLVECFQNFPLRCLSLDSHLFTSGASRGTLLEALPAVEELHLGYSNYYPCNIRDLRLFASHTRLPHLRISELPVALGAQYNQEETDSVQALHHRSQSHIELPSTFKDVGEQEDLSQLVAK